MTGAADSTSDETFAGGRVLPAVHAPAAVLSRPCADVDPRDPDVVTLARDLVATMRASPGCVGLAANQVGVASRLFVLDVTGHPKARTCASLVVLANPRLLAATQRKKGREGCLSVPDLTGDVARARRITVEGVVPGTGEVRLVEADAFEAIAFQHEIDHLDGLLFLDRVAGAHALFSRKTYL
ncbi:MAG: peptide deformylase [Actinomycetota bacterium]|nr:peptide deformylase [Actinomycetota bacterium]